MHTMLLQFNRMGFIFVMHEYEIIFYFHVMPIGYIIMKLLDIKSMLDI